MKRTTYYAGGFDSALPSLGRAEEWDSVAGTYTTWSEAGTQTSQRPLTALEVQEFAEAAARKTSEDNADSLRAKASQAFAINATFLALASPTNAQTLAQVKALTRETNAIIRLLLGALDTTDGT